jgi:hypothetical protein
MRLLFEALVARGNLKLHDLLPQLFLSVRERLQRTDHDLPDLARMGTHAVWCCDQADGLFELVAPWGELLARATNRAIDAIPSERSMLHTTHVLELTLKQPLPSGTIAAERRLVEQPQVAPA